VLPSQSVAGYPVWQSFLFAMQDHLREREINGELKSSKTPKERPLR
jgi:hypothetical protein